MARRLLLAVVALMAVVAVGGIGFATLSSSATINGSGSTGSITLAFESFANGNGAYSTCDWSGYSAGPPASVTLTVNNLAPGDSCSASLYIEDTGTLPVNTLATQITGTGGNYCTSPSGGGSYNCVQVTDSLGANLEYGGAASVSGSPVISASGGAVYYYVTVSVPSGTTQSPSATFTITATGSVGT
jgi:hypothetical protein